MDGNLSLRREDCLRIGLGNPDYGTLADAYQSTAISVFVASKAVFWVSAIALFVPTTS